MKKVFLTMMMLLFAVTGVMRADQLTVHDGTTTNSYVPIYGYWADAYNKCEMIYPADELSVMSGGMINSLTFYASQANVSWGVASFQVFVKTVEETTLSAYYGPEEATVVYEGSLSITGNEMVVTFNTPYVYSGGNLLVGIYETTKGTYSSCSWYGESVTGASIQGYSSSSLSGVSATMRNFLPKTAFDYLAGGAATVTTDPATLDLGYRPNGAWMAPFTFDIVNNGGAINVTAIEFNDNFFTANAELPAAVYTGNPLTVGVSTGETDPGTVSTEMAVLFDGGRNFETFNITATAYDPVDGDVWENAIEVTGMEPRTDYTNNLPTGIYKNYELPDGTTNPDGVFKVTFDEDVLFYAATEGSMSSTFIYNEDFEEVGGPAADNNYVYNGPTVNPGPISLWFSYPYTGTTTFYGTSAGGGFYFGYEISAEIIADNNLSACSITTIEAAARESYPYDLYILRGGDTPGDASVVAYVPMEYDPDAMYFFDVNLDEPVLVGNDNLWVIFYSDSPYAAYCGKEATDPNNAKIWTLNPNATTPAWSSNTTYTPLIYCRMLELPTGREVNMNLAEMTIKEGNGVYSETKAIDGVVQGVSRAQNHIAMKGGRTAAQTLTVHDGSATNSCVPVWGLWTDTDLKHEFIYPSSELASMNGGSISSLKFYANTANATWNGNFTVFVKEVTDATITAFLDGAGATQVYQGQLGIVANEMDITFTTPYNYNGGNLWVGVYYTNTTGYTSCIWKGETVTGASIYGRVGQSFAPTAANFLPKTTFSYVPGGGGEPGGDEPTPEPYDPYVPGFTADIDGVYLPAGTYYVVSASSTSGAEVYMAYADVPGPEEPIIVTPDPVLGEQGVEAPYLLEWTLGDYTAEMQVLCGTQYPPTTVLIDWTDELVESAFVTELLNNKTYNVQVKARNAAGTVKSAVAAFTTMIDPVEGFDGAESYLYPGDVAEFTWEPNGRTLEGYNLYYDNLATGETVKVNETPITGTEYSVEGLEYNNEAMGGYEFYVKAVYDSGESAPSDSFMVYMTGTATITGTVYDQDSITVIPNAAIEFRGVDEWEADQVITATADENGEYTCEVLVGQFTPYVVSPAYANDYPAAPEFVVEYGVPQEVNLYTHEFYFPLGMITATEQPEDNNVLVEWAWTPADLIVDFETGDFSQAEFTLPAQYPWVITTTNPYEGTYCMKSNCEGIASATSSIEATVEVPFEAGKMSFYVRTSSEANYDKFHFYIDGVEQGAALSGNNPYAFKEYSVSGGVHTYKWEYGKDSSVNSNDDCIYVDNITMYRQDVPAPPIVGATVYNFDDGTMMGWTSVDGDGDGNGWVSSSNPGIYHNAGVNLSGTGHDASEAYVISGSYANQTGQALTPNNFLVSPTQISAESGAQIQFWACAQDASYAAEHFGVAVSTTTATASAFTTIQEWTMTAKGPQGRIADNARDIRGLRQGTWYLYTADLSAYAGQDIWVAIRHFNCTDMFILNVDDITLADGSAKPMVRDDRTFQGFNLYRRDVKNGEDVADVELIATPAADVFEYIDNDWATLEYGMWQWGIQATYEGNAPAPDRDVITCDFESGLPTGWTVLDANSDGYTWCLTSDIPSTWTYYSGMTLDWYHNGTNAICSGSYINGVGAITPDDYLVTPQVNLGAGSSITFWAAPTDSNYPSDHFGVFVSDNGTSGWTMVSEWTLDAKGGGHNGGRASREGNGAKLGTWQQFTADLSAFSGAKYVAIRHFNCNDWYIMVVDDIELTTSGTTPPPGPTPTPTPAGSGLSDILWSNILEKDMISNVTVNVSLNNNQDPTGAVVTFEGPETYTATVDATGTVTFENFRKGEYVFNVELDAYYLDPAFVHDVTIEEDEMVFDVILYEYILPVEDLYVSPTGWAMWSGATAGTTPTPGPGPGPGPGPSGGTSFTEGFEGGLNGWQVLTINADGGEWIHSDDNLGGYSYSEHAHGGTGFAMCYSFVDYVGAFNTDSYMYTPQKYDIVAGSTLTFYADNANDSYPENFSVCVSTADAPASAADFTQVWSGGAKMRGMDNSMVRHNANRYDNWRAHSIDLSAYAGQSVYIAFHDVNYDMYEIWIDDVELTAGTKGDRAPLSFKVKLDGVFEGETENPYFQHNVEGFEAGSEHVTSVAALYATGLGDWMDYTWTYTPCDEYTGVTNYTATADGNDVTLSWTLSGTPGPGPGPTPPPTGGWTENFDNGVLPTGWTTIDADGDGSNWVFGSVAMSTGYGHNGSTDMILSKSYDNTLGALNPNNYLVTSQVTPSAGSTFTFYACAQDNAWAAEHFGVAVSTGSQTVAADFSMVQEWTMTAKDGGVLAPGRDGQMRAQGNWYEYTVDLSSYAGQAIYIAIRHFNCTDMFYLDVDDVAFTTSTKTNRAMWDIVYEFDATSGYQYGVASDGTNIYTSSWSASSTSMFYKYDMQGNFIEEFNISGCGQLRGMTYDGQYFYGVANASTIYCVDLANHTLISSTPSAYGAMRCITYDPERDGFWVVGNWSGNLTLVDRSGAIVQAAGAPTSASDVAYYKDPEGVEHIYYLKNATGDGELYEYNITTGTMGTTPVINCASNPNWTGSSGGCFVGTYGDKTCFFADSQQSPQHIVIYELDASSTPTPPPGPTPTPGELLGVYVFRDGELISGQTPLSANSFTDTNVEAGEHEYCVRVVYSDYAMSCPECETVTIGEVSCDPVTNLTATQTENPTYGMGVLLEWEGNANSYKVYQGDELLGQITGTQAFIYNIGDGEYTFGVVAVYADCEAEMVTVTIVYDAIGENEIVNNLYPNPTNDKVTIEAQGINHITVANALGQVVYDADVDADMIELNLGQYNAGLYLMRVSTVNGVSVKRVTVVK